MTSIQTDSPPIPASRSNRFTPSIDLLLLSCRLNLSKNEIDRLKLISKSEIDWDQFHDLAVFHRVFALIHHNLTRFLPGLLPPGTEADLSAMVSENQLRILQLTAELIRISNTFHKRKIPFISLKGPALAQSVYGNIGLRPAGDLDLLVDPADVPAALEALRSLGFAAILREQGPVATEIQERATCRYLYHFILFDEERRMAVELHFNLSPKKLPFPVPLSELFSNSVPVKIGGSEIPVLKPIDNLLYLCVHAGKHAWSRLEWLVGVAGLLNSFSKSDEHEIRSLAQKRNALLPLLLGLLLSADLLESNPFPNLVREARQNRTVADLARKMAASLHLGKEIPGMQARFQLSLYPTLRERTRWLLHSGFRPDYADIRAANLRFHSLYYLVRPFRLAGKSILPDFIWLRLKQLLRIGS